MSGCKGKLQIKLPPQVSLLWYQISYMTIPIQLIILRGLFRFGYSLIPRLVSYLASWISPCTRGVNHCLGNFLQLFWHYILTNTIWMKEFPIDLNEKNCVCYSSEKLLIAEKRMNRMDNQRKNIILQFLLLRCFYHETACSFCTEWFHLALLELFWDQLEHGLWCMLQYYLKHTSEIRWICTYKGLLSFTLVHIELAYLF